MSNVKTGFWSAFGAVLGGAVGAAAGRAAVIYRPRLSRYAHARGDQEIEDGIVIGGATGAVVGAFIGGTVGGEDPPPQLPAR